MHRDEDLCRNVIAEPLNLTIRSSQCCESSRCSGALPEKEMSDFVCQYKALAMRASTRIDLNHQAPITLQNLSTAALSGKAADREAKRVGECPGIVGGRI